MGDACGLHVRGCVSWPENHSVPWQPSNSSSTSSALQLSELVVSQGHLESSTVPLWDVVHCPCAVWICNTGHSGLDS